MPDKLQAKLKGGKILEASKNRAVTFRIARNYNLDPKKLLTIEQVQQASGAGYWLAPSRPLLSILLLELLYFYVINSRRQFQGHVFWSIACP